MIPLRILSGLRNLQPTPLVPSGQRRGCWGRPPGKANWHATGMPRESHEQLMVETDQNHGNVTNKYGEYMKDVKPTKGPESHMLKTLSSMPMSAVSAISLPLELKSPIDDRQMLHPRLVKSQSKLQKVWSLPFMVYTWLSGEIRSPGSMQPFLFMTWAVSKNMSDITQNGSIILYHCLWTWLADSYPTFTI